MFAPLFSAQSSLGPLILFGNLLQIDIGRLSKLFYVIYPVYVRTIWYSNIRKFNFNTLGVRFFLIKKILESSVQPDVTDCPIQLTQLVIQCVKWIVS